MRVLFERPGSYYLIALDDVMGFVYCAYDGKAHPPRSIDSLQTKGWWEPYEGPQLDILRRVPGYEADPAIRLSKTLVTVPPHPRVTDNGVEQVDGYTYWRESSGDGVPMPEGYTTSSEPTAYAGSGYFYLRNERGSASVEISYRTMDDYVEIESIYVPPEQRKRHLAEAAITALHEKTGKTILHGSFASPEGAALGFDMARDFPEWNKVWTHFEDGQMKTWEPGTPIDTKWSTFDSVDWALRGRLPQVAKKYGTALSRLSEVVGLTRTYVPGYVKEVNGKVVHVDGYWRENADPEVKEKKVASNAVGKLRDTGGFSLRRSGYEPKGGFMVALPNAEETFDSSSITEDDIASYMDRHEEDLKKDGVYFGGWLDNQSGKVYLDLSKNEKDLDRAKKLGKKNKQLAIFDLGSFDEIRLARQDAKTVVFLPKDNPAEALRLIREGSGIDEQPEKS